MTYYLKYRPQLLSELDQELVRNSLIKVFGSGETPHAFLFSGPRGTGKTSAARIVAKILNCEELSGKPVKNKNLSVEPCNKCNQCKSITRGDSLDVIELDAASHRGIDDIRQIKEAVKLAPVMAKKKIYIVDEAHMLTTEASNALLKTLEEPPSHVVFILATTNPEKLIDTIRSRVTNILFKKATTNEIVNSLKRIAKAEKIDLSDDSLVLMAQKAEGSFRDGAKILEQVVAEVDKLTPEAIETFLFNSKSFLPKEFLKLLASKSTKEALLMLQSGVQNGLSAKEIGKSLVEELRKVLLGQVMGDSDTGFLSKTDLIELIELFTEASSKLAYSFIEEVPLEIAIIKWCESGKDVKSKLSDVGEKNSNSIPKEVKAQKLDDKLDQMIEAEGQVDTNKIEQSSVESFSSEDFDKIDGKLWSKVLSSIGPDHASTEALLKAAHPLGFAGNTLKLGVYYKFHKEHLESNAHRRILEEILTAITGNAVRVVCELTTAPSKPNNFNSHLVSDNGHQDVVLTEPKRDITISTLTNQNGNDIIDIAEKIFSN